ncbi:MAG: CehA/McbA family metallohydrolase [Deltaproteobacteria bacterium]|nr:CehA/McbA family metallohydrolase [Deltaproteobacteria bacterium]
MNKMPLIRRHGLSLVLFASSLLFFGYLGWERKETGFSELIPNGRSGEWYQGDTHCHTDHSDGGLQRFFPLLPADMMVKSQIRTALRRKLDFLMITDHRTLSHTYDPDFVRPEREILIIPSEEWGIDVHATVWGIQDEIENVANVEGSQWAVQLAHAQGGLIAMAHPARRRKSWFLRGKEHYKVEGMDAIEIWSGGWFGHFLSNNAEAVRFWEREFLNKGKKIVGIGASDSHVAQANVVGGVGYPTTVVFASGLTQGEILDGIRKGHVYVKSGRTPLALSFEADADGDGRYETLMGEEIQASPSIPIDFRIRLRRARGMKARLISQKGVLAAEKITHRDQILHFRLKPADSWYRIEVLRFGRITEALTNPIYIRRQN